MNIVFLNAALSGLLVLGLVPLLVHLFARSRPPEYRFSSNEFIQRIVRETMRVRKPREWLLLLLRTLAFLALILAFLRPFAFPEKPVGGLFQKRNVVFIVDATASMACVEGAQTRFGAACAELSHGLSGLSSNDSANIVWIRSTPEPVFPGLSSNLHYLQDATRRARVSAETGSVLPAMKLALDMLDRAEGRREIRIISDFQQSTWAGVELAAPKDIQLAKLKIGQAEAGNSAIVGLRCEPASPVRGEDVSLFCDIRNFSAQPRRCSVQFNAGEVRQTFEVMLNAWGTATATCKFKAPRAGTMPVSATLDEDSFPSDDKRWCILRVRDSMRVGIFEDPECADKQLAATWRKALEALGWVRVEKVADLGADTHQDLLLLAGWKGNESQALRKQLAAGTAVVCFPCPTEPSVSALAALSGSGSPKAQPVSWETSNEHHLRVSDPKADLFRIFTKGDYGDPSRGRIQARFSLGQAPMESVNLLEYEDGTPALARVGKKANLYLWNLAVDPRWSDWAAQPEFVTLMGELLLASRPQNQAVEGVFESGESALTHLDLDALPSEVELLDEAGASQPVLAKAGEARCFGSKSPLKPGLYTWKVRNTPVAWSAVNFPSVESDLRSLADAEVRQTNALASVGSRILADTGQAMPLWPWLLGLGMLMIVAEGGVLLWKD